jgi:hypothetical protein
MNKKIIKEIILFGKVLYEQGLNHSHSGNISVRDGNNILIKKHGVMLGYLTEKDIVSINLDNDGKDKEVGRSESSHKYISDNLELLGSSCPYHLCYGIVFKKQNDKACRFRRLFIFA